MLPSLFRNKNYDIAITMSSSLLTLCWATALAGGSSIFKSKSLLPWLEGFKYINQCHCTAIIIGYDIVVLCDGRIDGRTEGASSDTTFCHTIFTLN